jgi:hypothetical protein
MISRREFATTGLAAAAVLAAGDRAFGQSKPDTSSGHVGPFTKCAEACSACQRECDSCARHCATLIGQGDKHHMMTLATCLDCAVICTTAAQIVSREGPFSNLVCSTCADACRRCGDECQRHGGDDQIMARCAAECRRCETACREMVKVDKFQ